MCLPMFLSFYVVQKILITVGRNPKLELSESLINLIHIIISAVCATVKTVYKKIPAIDRDLFLSIRNSINFCFLDFAAYCDSCCKQSR